MPKQPSGTYHAVGELLRRYREAAGLSQEALAERAGLSPRGLLYLERGMRRPYPATLRRLADALSITAEEREALAQAVRRVAPVPATAPPSTEPPASPGPLHNLPASLSSFIGREHDQARVQELLAASRLVTLVGAGGVGKTRLALAVAAANLDAYLDGVWLVELAPLADPVLVPRAVAQVLGPQEEPDRPVLETLAAHCAGKCLLLLLDNCEHLLAASAALAAALLRAAPALHILATSREPLRLTGEQRYRVPSLSVPDPRRLPAGELAGAYEAVRLFVQRAQEHQPDFALTAHNAQAVAEVCARLDGIPLAIELAAARVASMSVAAIAARLDDRFRLLTGGPRTALPRQQTLRAALDWSYDLLSLPEQLLLRRLAVFAGGWTLEAVEQVGAGGPLAEADILDVLSTLVNKSLVHSEATSGHPRYHLLETVRQYGRERLAASGEAVQVRDRHLAWCLALAELAAPALLGAEQEVWLARLEEEHDNLRAALHWSLREGADWRGVQLAATLWRFWEIRGLLHEGRQWLDEALALGGTVLIPLADRARTLNAAGNLAYNQGDFARAQALHEESLALRRELGDIRGIATSLNNLGNLAWSQGENERARALHEESLALQRSLGDTWHIANALNNLGLVLEQQGNYEAATERFTEGLALYRELGNSEGIARLLGNLGRAVHDQGDYARARLLYQENLELDRKLGHRRSLALTLYSLGSLTCEQGDYAAAAALAEESLALYRELGDKQGIARALHSRADAARAQGDLVAAAALYRESLVLRQSLYDKPGVAEGLEGLAKVRRLQGQPRPAAHLLGAAVHLRETSGSPLPRRHHPAQAEVVASLREALGEDAFTTTWLAGRALSLEAAIALALDESAP